MTAGGIDQAREILRRTFGHADFRGLQAGVIGELLAGRSAVAVLPTGGGKSLCYQIPALVRPGLALVVSPLIALMSDQVAALQQSGVAAEKLDSNTAPQDRAETWRRIEDGALDLLYVSPEGLMAGAMLERLSRLPIALVAVDEAHCVSQWGHDFRPEYRTLGRLAQVFPHAPRLAVTATADARTREDIRNELGLTGAAEFVDSFARPELQLAAERKQGRGSARVLELVGERRGRSGVVYAGSRDSTDAIAAALIQTGVPAQAYHAGLDKTVRSERLERFLQADEAVMVATIAFGMGIDKPDVRYVIHADPPGSIEAYWQEVGRAGRDGAVAEGITLYSSADMGWALRRIDGRDAPDVVKQVQRRKVGQLYAMLGGINCRAAAVRRYFGETGAEPCGHCDLCLRPPQSHDSTLAAQKALSAVHRLGGRFGRGRIVDHLLGKTKQVSEFESGLSTYGVGKDMAQAEWRDLLDQLLFEGLLREDPNDGRPLVAMGEADAVRAVYRSERRILLRAPDAAERRPRKARRTREPPQDMTPDDMARFESLRAWRREEAARQHLPPYVIFQDKTLADIARRRPATPSDLAQIPGVGESKLQRYGSSVLGVLAMGVEFVPDLSEPPLAPAGDRAREMRGRLTPPEAKLWGSLRGHQLNGLKFRRQHPLGVYVLDFYCAEAKLAVEIDGQGHNLAGSHDERRDAWVASQGIRTLRIPAEWVLKSFDQVLRRISEATNGFPPSSSVAGAPDATSPRTRGEEID
ncbi:MAG: recQ [Caulobacteraceae bacterium]|nr:recQ [Caulobacteraceae bacterium]